MTTPTASAATASSDEIIAQLRASLQSEQTKRRDAEHALQQLQQQQQTSTAAGANPTTTTATAQSVWVSPSNAASASNQSTTVAAASHNLIKDPQYNTPFVQQLMQQLRQEQQQQFESQLAQQQLISETKSKADQQLIDTLRRQIQQQQQQQTPTKQSASDTPIGVNRSLGVPNLSPTLVNAPLTPRQQQQQQQSSSRVHPSLLSSVSNASPSGVGNNGDGRTITLSADQIRAWEDTQKAHDKLKLRCDTLVSDLKSLQLQSQEQIQLIAQQRSNLRDYAVHKRNLHSYRLILKRLAVACYIQRWQWRKVARAAHESISESVARVWLPQLREMTQGTTAQVGINQNQNTNTSRDASRATSSSAATRWQRDNFDDASSSGTRVATAIQLAPAPEFKPHHRASLSIVSRVGGGGASGAAGTDSIASDEEQSELENWSQRNAQLTMRWSALNNVFRKQRHDLRERMQSLANMGDRPSATQLASAGLLQHTMSMSQKPPSQFTTVRMPGAGGGPTHVLQSQPSQMLQIHIGGIVASGTTGAGGAGAGASAASPPTLERQLQVVDAQARGEVLSPRSKLARREALLARAVRHFAAHDPSILSDRLSVLQASTPRGLNMSSAAGGAFADSGAQPMPLSQLSYMHFRASELYVQTLVTQQTLMHDEAMQRLQSAIEVVSDIAIVSRSVAHRAQHAAQTLASFLYDRDDAAAASNASSHGGVGGRRSSLGGSLAQQQQLAQITMLQNHIAQLERHETQILQRNTQLMQLTRHALAHVCACELSRMCVCSCIDECTCHSNSLSEDERIALLIGVLQQQQSLVAMSSTATAVAATGGAGAGRTSPTHRRASMPSTTHHTAAAAGGHHSTKRISLIARQQQHQQAKNHASTTTTVATVSPQTTAAHAAATTSHKTSSEHKTQETDSAAAAAAAAASATATIQAELKRTQTKLQSTRQQLAQQLLYRSTTDQVLSQRQLLTTIQSEVNRLTESQQQSQQSQQQQSSRQQQQPTPQQLAELQQLQREDEQQLAALQTQLQQQQQAQQQAAALAQQQQATLAQTQRFAPRDSQQLQATLVSPRGNTILSLGATHAAQVQLQQQQLHHHSGKRQSAVQNAVWRQAATQSNSVVTSPANASATRTLSPVTSAHSPTPGYKPQQEATKAKQTMAAPPSLLPVVSPPRSPQHPQPVQQPPHALQRRQPSMVSQPKPASPDKPAHARVQYMPSEPSAMAVGSLLAAMSPAPSASPRKVITAKTPVKSFHVQKLPKP